ncbi:uncharacterized [Tachysurus ichikawai]
MNKTRPLENVAFVAARLYPYRRQNEQEGRRRRGRKRCMGVDLLILCAFPWARRTLKRDGGRAARLSGERGWSSNYRATIPQECAR